MPDRPLDEAFSRQLLKIGLVTPQDLEAAREVLAQRRPSVPLAQVLVERGLLTAEQRENIERAIRRQRTEAGRLGPYRLLKKIGAGGMGAVYLAELPGSRERVALKVLPKASAQDEESLRRFLREVDAARRLEHPNIVRSSGGGEDRGYHFYVMEFVEGETLGTRLRREEAVDPDEATQIVHQIARGLAYAHGLGIVHRDIKPDNVIVSIDGVAKILDMGLSKIIGEEQSFLTTSGVMVGTPHYISPEQARADKDVDGRADLYSLGATYYHLVTGEPPFRGHTAVEVIAQHLNKQLPDPRDVRDGVPEGVVHVLRRMLAKERDDRYPNAFALIADLDAVLQGRVPESKALDPSRSTVAQPLSKEARERFRARIRRRPPPRPSRLPLWIGAAVAALALVAVAVRPKAPPPDAKPPPAEVVDVPKLLRLDLGGGVEMEFIPVKPGAYRRGGVHDKRDAIEIDAHPAHPVELTRGFHLGKYEVTRRQFAAFVDATGHRTEAEQNGTAYGRPADGVWALLPGNTWRSPANLAQTDDHPVVCVSWNDAKAFCDWLSNKHKREVRLPTEAEWEYACRAETLSSWASGELDSSLTDYAWIATNSNWRTQPVGRKKPNAWGFHDMHGNAWEWCLDWDGPYASTPLRDPRGPLQGARRVLRGGAWYLGPETCRSSTRGQVGPSLRFTSVGFRVALP